MGGGGLDCYMENLDSLSSPFKSQTGGAGRGGIGHRGAPPPNLTITHTPGAPPGSWAGRVQVCGS